MALLAALQRPDTTLSFGIMIDILLMVVIGGMGTLVRRGDRRDAVIVIAQYYLQDGMQALSATRRGRAAAAATCSIPTAGCCGWACCSSSSVYFFPFGIVGKLRMMAMHKD